MLPVKKILSKRLCSSLSLFSIPPSVQKTNSGGKQSEMSFLMTAAVCGVSSDGLKTAQFPAAIAATSGAIRSWKG